MFHAGHVFFFTFFPTLPTSLRRGKVRKPQSHWSATHLETMQMCPTKGHLFPGWKIPVGVEQLETWRLGTQPLKGFRTSTVPECTMALPDPPNQQFHGTSLMFGKGWDALGKALGFQRRRNCVSHGPKPAE